MTPSSGASGGRNEAIKASLRGHDFDTQVQMLTPGGRAGGDIQAAAAKGISGSGGALPQQPKIQQSFGGYDISNVTAHTDANAAKGAAAMGADAYATGNHVVLGQGGGDLRTQAHEATHVIQQREGVSIPGGIGKAGDANEKHADAVADLVVDGKSAEGLLGQVGGGGATEGVQLKPSNSNSPPAINEPRKRHNASTGTAYSNPELDDQIDGWNVAAGGYADEVATTKVARELPQPLPHLVGDPGYYVARYHDFERRNATRTPRPTPPSYYLFYGYKYALRFTQELAPKLSAEGKAWVARTRTLLQLAIENRLLAKPDAFADLELNESEFKEFCFGSHADAYVGGGLIDLSIADKYTIATTPDWEDLTTSEGLAQVLEVGGKALLHDGWEYVKSTIPIVYAIDKLTD